MRLLSLKIVKCLLYAVLINGIKGHTLDMDDGNRFGNVHPAVVVLPTALALAEQQTGVLRRLLPSTS